MAKLVGQTLRQVRSAKNRLGENGVQQVHRVLRVCGRLNGQLHLFVQRLNGRHPLPVLGRLDGRGSQKVFTSWWRVDFAARWPHMVPGAFDAAKAALIAAGDVRESCQGGVVAIAPGLR